MPNRRDITGFLYYGMLLSSLILFELDWLDYFDLNDRSANATNARNKVPPQNFRLRALLSAEGNTAYSRPTASSSAWGFGGVRSVGRVPVTDSCVELSNAPNSCS
jgi:hypothetical protein